MGYKVSSRSSMTCSSHQSALVERANLRRRLGDDLAQRPRRQDVDCAISHRLERRLGRDDAERNSRSTRSGGNSEMPSPAAANMAIVTAVLQVIRWIGYAPSCTNHFSID